MLTLNLYIDVLCVGANFSGMSTAHKPSAECVNIILHYEYGMTSKIMF